MLMKKRILFFIDPVPSHKNTLFYGNKLDLINRLADAHAADCDISVIASPQLSRVASANIAYKFNISADLCLKRYDYDVNQYILDVYKEEVEQGNCNEDIIASLSHADGVIKPDYVISFTDNAYLRSVFQDRCLFSEVSPIPRWFTEPSLLFDPYGFQFDNAIKRYVDGSKIQEFDNTFVSAFEDHWLTPVASWSESSGMAQWVKSVRGKSKVLVLALQPANDFNFVGGRVAGDEIALIRRAADAFSSDFKILVFWHASSIVPNSSLIDELQESYPCLAFPPEHIWKGQTESALIYADAVAGVSSNLLFLGAALGLEVYTFGISRFSCLSKYKYSDRSRRLDLLAFAVEYYASTERSLLDNCSSLADKLDKIKGKLLEFESSHEVSNSNSICRVLHFAYAPGIA